MQNDQHHLSLGPLRLQVDPTRAKTYALETGGDGLSAPLAYPAVWLAEPTLLEIIQDLCRSQDVIPVHESQSFFYTLELALGESYDLYVLLKRETEPSRLIIEATIKTTTNRLVATIETILRLVPYDIMKAKA
ncbi:MAG: hypothetical protein ACKOB7_06165 [Methylocystis sp.]